MRAFFKRLFCGHKGLVWHILAINYDGTTVVKCKLCGKIKKVPL